MLLLAIVITEIFNIDRHFYYGFGVIVRRDTVVVSYFFDFVDREVLRHQ